MMHTHWQFPGALPQDDITLGSGRPTYVRGQDFNRGDVVHFLQGSVSDAAIDETKARGADGLDQNAVLLVTTHSYHKYGLVGIVNQEGGIADDEQGAVWTEPGRIYANVYFRNNGSGSATEAVVIGQPVFLCAASGREEHLTLNASDTNVGRCVGYTLEAIPEGTYGTTAGEQLIKIWFTGSGALGAAS